MKGNTLEAKIQCGTAIGRFERRGFCWYLSWNL